MTKTKLLNTHTRTRGFTLIELLVVISIIGMLSSIVVAEVQSARWTAEGVAEGARARAYVFALESYVNETGRFPTFEPANMTTSACLGDAPTCLITSGGAWTIGHHPAMDAIVAQYAPGVGDVNVRELVFDFGGTEVTSQSLYYKCETGNMEMTECLWAQMHWITRGRSCGVEGSHSDYYAPAKVSFCRYQFGENPFN